MRVCLPSMLALAFLAACSTPGRREHDEGVDTEPQPHPAPTAPNTSEASPTTPVRPVRPAHDELGRSVEPAPTDQPSPPAQADRAPRVRISKRLANQPDEVVVDLPHDRILHDPIFPVPSSPWRCTATWSASPSASATSVMCWHESGAGVSIFAPGCERRTMSLFVEMSPAELDTAIELASGGHGGEIEPRGDWLVEIDCLGRSAP